MNIFRIFFIPVEALRLIVRNRSLLVLSLGPIVTTAVAYYFLIGWIDRQILEFIQARLLSWGISEDSQWFQFVAYVVKFMGLLMAMVSFSFVAIWFSTPFSDFLAEATEKILGILPRETGTVGLFFRRIGIDLAKTFLVSILGVMALFLAWIPGLGWISVPFFWTLIAFQFLTYPQTRRQLSAIESVRWMMKRPLDCIIFGAVFSVLLAVPMLSVFMVPIAVVGGTVFFSRYQD